LAVSYVKRIETIVVVTVEGKYEAGVFRQVLVNVVAWEVLL